MGFFFFNCKSLDTHEVTKWMTRGKYYRWKNSFCTFLVKYSQWLSFVGSYFLKSENVIIFSEIPLLLLGWVQCYWFLQTPTRIHKISTVRSSFFKSWVKFCYSFIADVIEQSTVNRAVWNSYSDFVKCFTWWYLKIACNESACYPSPLIEKQFVIVLL